MNNKPINCCNLTKICAFITQIRFDKLREGNLNDPMRFFNFGVIDAMWGVYITLQENQALCEFCSKFTEQLVKFRNDLAKGTETKLCEFCGRTIKELENNLTEIPREKYCCPKGKYMVVDEVAVFPPK